MDLYNSTNHVKVVVGFTVGKTAHNLASDINGQSLDFTASATNGVVTITAKAFN